MSANEMLFFLNDLKQNNSLSWMAEHRDSYKAASENFIDLLRRLIERLAAFDPSVAFLQPKELTFRLNRDTRFSKDKSPYHPAFRAHISSAGKLPIPAGYYINIAPGNIFLGAGVHAEPFPQATAMIRNRIYADGAAFERIVKQPAFAENFILTGAQLKNVPRGYDPDFPQGEYLKYKSWDIEYHMPDSALDDEAAFLEEAAEKYKLMRPFNDYLNAALTEFRMPVR